MISIDTFMREMHIIHNRTQKYIKYSKIDEIFAVIFKNTILAISVQVLFLDIKKISHKHTQSVD